MSQTQTQTLVFAKKFRLPSPAAHIIQTLNMAWGFQAAGARVKIFPGISCKMPCDLVPEIEKNYRLDKISRPLIRFFKGDHKGMYGFLFRAALIKEWLTNPDALFFSRDVTETIFLLSLRKVFQKQQKIIYEMHDSVFLEHQARGAKDAHTYKKYEKKILSQVDGVIYTGRYLKKKVEEIYTPSTPSLVAVPGFNKHIFSPLPPAKKSPKVVIGYFGSLHPAKGISLLLDVVKILPDNYHLRIIGGNPATEYTALQQRVRKEFDTPERVEFTGQVPPCGVRQHLAGCRMIIIPFISDVEFLSPIKMYEALGMELPVVATPVPAIQGAAATLPHVLVSHGSRPSDLAETIRSLGDHPDRVKKLYEKTRAMSTRYDWESRARKMYAFASAL